MVGANLQMLTLPAFPLLHDDPYVCTECTNGQICKLINRKIEVKEKQPSIDPDYPSLCNAEKCLEIRKMCDGVLDCRDNTQEGDRNELLSNDTF